MERIRTLHITPSVRLLGARRSLLTLVKHLAGTRVEPLVLVPSRGGLTEELDRLRLRYEVLKLPPWRKGASWFSMPGQITALRQLLEREKIDLVHCNEIYPNPHAIVAAGQGSVRRELLVRALHQRALRPMRIPVVTHMRLSVTPRMVRNYWLPESTRLIAVSHGAAADFDPFPWKSERVRVVHNGIDLEAFEQSRQHRTAIREELGFAEHDFIIGQFGLMMPRKRPRFLIEAAPAILEQIPDARFLFIGDSSPGHESYLEQLQILAEDLAVQHAVRFVPFQKDIARFFGALDLNMLVSDDEGFGRVVVEAGAAGVPTIGSRVGGIPELIRDGETGYLIGGPGMNDDEFRAERPRLIELVALLAGNSEFYMQMSRAAHAYATQNFSAEEYVRNVVRVFDEAIQEFRDREDFW
ncbi:MAG: glycosyltransferase family 4 protein [Candidatus Sumerlaeaceae bacterium]